MKKTIILAVLLLLISTNASLACSRDPKVLEWLEKNGDIEQGKITLTKYPGAYETKASLTWTIEQGEKSYTSYFKGGIVAYDQELDEHYILFAPANLYNWSRQGGKGRQVSGHRHTRGGPGRDQPWDPGDKKVSI